jgi:hypothetical protein
MVSVDTVLGSSTRIQTDSHVVQSRRMDLARDASRWRERLFRRFVGNELELRWRQLQQSHGIKVCQIDLPTKRILCL